MSDSAVSLLPHKSRGLGLPLETRLPGPSSPGKGRGHVLGPPGPRGGPFLPLRPFVLVTPFRWAGGERGSAVSSSFPPKGSSGSPCLSQTWVPEPVAGDAIKVTCTSRSHAQLREGSNFCSESTSKGRVRVGSEGQENDTGGAAEVPENTSERRGVPGIVL